MDKTNFDKEIYGDVIIIKEQKTYFVWSSYCECGRSDCGLARGCGERISPFFPSKKDAIKWMNQQEDKESHEYNKKTWSIKSKTKRIKKDKTLIDSISDLLWHVSNDEETKISWDRAKKLAENFINS